MTNSGMNRYARQVRFAPMGESGQAGLLQSTAAVVGMGALGCVIAQHLVRSGVGRVKLIDRDIVEWTNLQRQVLYTEDDALGTLPKAEAAAARLRAVNSGVVIEAYAEELSASNAERLLAGSDIIMDGTDNFGTRYLMNDYAVKHRIPWVYGGAVGSGGMTMTILPGETPCYRCMFPEPPPPGTTDTCESAGVLSPLVDIVGSLQAIEAMKWLAGRRDRLHGGLLQLDIWDTRFTKLGLAGGKRDSCPACGEGRYDYLDIASDQSDAATLCGRLTVQLRPAASYRLHLPELAARLAPIGTVELNPYVLRLSLEEGLVLILFPDGRALVQGTEDAELARRVYARIMAP
jgi:molybdopterin-synthase adenylyltransferase